MQTEITPTGDVMRITSADGAEQVTAIDIRAEIETALTDGSESEVLAQRIRYEGGQGGWIVFFPNAGRGAVMTGGDSQWTDCASLDDLLTCYANPDERWSN